MEKIIPVSSKTDKSFSESNLPDYDLVLQVSERSCAYSVFDNGSSSFIALESYESPLTRVTERNPWLKGPFRSVRIIVENNRSTLVPSGLFEESAKDAYLEFMVEPEEEEQVLFDRLTHPDIVNIYGVNGILHGQVRGFFPGAKICHLSTMLIERTWMNFKNLITGPRIFIFVRDEGFNMLIFEKKQLLYSNAFVCKAPGDYIYFILFAMEQYNLNPEEIPMTLYGNINDGSPLYQLIFRYVRNVDFGMRGEPDQYSPVFDDLPGHYFWTLLTSVPCVS